MKHQHWNGAAETLSDQDFSCARARARNAASGEALRLGWRLMRTIGSICANAVWAFVDFWNIPVLGPSEQQR